MTRHVYYSGSANWNPLAGVSPSEGGVVGREFGSLPHRRLEARPAAPRGNIQPQPPGAAVAATDRHRRRECVAPSKRSGSHPLAAAALLPVQRQGKGAVEEEAAPRRWFVATPFGTPAAWRGSSRDEQVADAMPQRHGPGGADPGRVEEARREADVVQEDVPRLLPRLPRLRLVAQRSARRRSRPSGGSSTDARPRAGGGQRRGR